MPFKRQIPLGLLLLVVGGMIYVSFRPTSLLLFHSLDFLGLSAGVDAWRDLVSEWRPHEFIVYSLPGGLWAAAYILLTHGLLAYKPALPRVCIASLIPLTGIGSELLQRWGLLPGTFDIADLLCYTVPLLLLIIYEITKDKSIWQISLTASPASN
ncbi:MAG: hypothetical protein IJ190_01700 [Prevotella sp.]|nr:hypothetical protein [Prevotella sp.]